MKREVEVRRPPGKRKLRAFASALQGGFAAVFRCLVGFLKERGAAAEKRKLRTSASALQGGFAAVFRCLVGFLKVRGVPPGKRKLRTSASALQGGFAAVLALLLVHGGLADSWAAEPVQAGGYLKNYALLYDFPSSGLFAPTSGILAGDNARFRIDASWRLNDRLSLTGAYDFAPRIQDSRLNLLGASFVGQIRSDYRAFDLDRTLYPGGDSPSADRRFSILQNLDRAFLTLHLSFADLYVGRQVIAWGAAKVVNPTDVIAPFAFNELDVEDRVGVDAVRLRVPLGSLSELDAGYVFGRDFAFDRSAFFLRSRFYAAKTDFSVLGVGFQDNLLLGFDVARSLGGAGLWVEAAEVFADALSESRHPANQDYFRLSTGSDYTLRDGTYLFAEYHYSQAGAPEPSDYLDRFSTTAYREGAVYLLGRHYLSGGLSRDLTPLLTLNAETLISLTDGSLYLLPALEYSLSQNVYLSGGAYLGIGASPRQAADSSTQIESEFGSYPRLFYVSVRYYF